MTSARLTHDILGFINNFGTEEVNLIYNWYILILLQVITETDDTGGKTLLLCFDLTKT